MQLHSFRDFDWPVDQILVDLQDTYATEKVILSPKRKFLLSYLVFFRVHQIKVLGMVLQFSICFAVYHDIIFSHVEKNQ